MTPNNPFKNRSLKVILKRFSNGLSLKETCFCPNSFCMVQRNKGPEVSYDLRATLMRPSCDQQRCKRQSSVHNTRCHWGCLHTLYYYTPITEPLGLQHATLPYLYFVWICRKLDNASTYKHCLLRYLVAHRYLPRH